MSGDVSRPRIHLTPDRGWINDPLGLTVRDGIWHLFFQFVPGQVRWGPEQRWGHATSHDGLCWSEGQVALAPGDGDGGIWSGSIVEPEGQPAALFYTTIDLADVEIGKARIARAVDADWTTWAKGPIVAEVPDGVEVVAYRDPYVFHDGDCWRMLMGAGLKDGTATALVYRSDDVHSWTYDGLLAERHRDEVEPVWTGAAWECPQLFPLDDRWVLTVSAWEPGQGHHEAYAVGAYAHGRFTAEHWGQLTYGSPYAGSTFVDGEGTRGLVHWLRDVVDPAGRWAGALSVPHEVHLDGDRLVANPHRSVLARRGGATAVSSGHTLEAASTCDVEWVAQDAAELIIADAAGARVLTLTASAGELVLAVESEKWSMPLVEIEVRLVLDGPVVEVFTTQGTLAAPVPARTATVTITVRGSDAMVFPLR